MDHIRWWREGYDTLQMKAEEVPCLPITSLVPFCACAYDL